MHELWREHGGGCSLPGWYPNADTVGGLEFGDALAALEIMHRDLEAYCGWLLNFVPFGDVADGVLGLGWLRPGSRAGANEVGQIN